MKFDRLATPEVLDCEHYSSIIEAGEPSQATSTEDVQKPARAKAVITKPRVKRDINGTRTIQNANPEDSYSDAAVNWTDGPGKEKLNAYHLSTKNMIIKIESENKEMEFQILVNEQDLDRLICSNGWSENCLIRSMHSEKILLWRHIGYDKRQEKFELIMRLEVFSPPRVRVSDMKEIRYRDCDLLRELTKDKTITANYKCLPSSYNGRTSGDEEFRIHHLQQPND